MKTYELGYYIRIRQIGVDAGDAHNRFVKSLEEAGDFFEIVGGEDFGLRLLHHKEVSE